MFKGKAVQEEPLTTNDLTERLLRKIGNQQPTLCNNTEDRKP